MPDPPTGTVTYLLTDIEGSTRLWEQAPEAMRRAHARHLEIIAEAVAAHHGTMVLERGEGDSAFAWFPLAPDALAAVTDLQLALHSEPWPTPRPLRVRAALHTGAPDFGGEGYNATTVNRCARIRAIAHGGQTLLSQAAHLLAQDSLPEGASLRDLGRRHLRDLQRPEQVFQLCHPALPADFPPLLSLESYPNNLPRQLTSFIGREPEMAEVCRLLASMPLLTLTGAGGCGKTRLALQAAAERLEEYADGVWFVDLAPLTDPALIPQAVARALGVREEAGRPLTATLTDYLGSRALLLVLDNCEHLVDACARLVEDLLLACPRLRLLATSREPLNVAGETLWRVPSLLPPDPDRLPDAEKDMTAALVKYDAVRLFVVRAAQHRPEFRLARRNAGAVAQVCRRLDGIPLALELAAARVRAMSVEQIAARLDDRFRLLTGGSRAVLPRHQTLRALIDWSYDLLSEQERLLLARLSVFAGGWTLEAAESVCAGEGIAGGEVLDLLAGLVDRSLALFEEPEQGEGRYRLLETVRQYGAEKLAEAGEAGAVRERHRDWFLALAEEVEPNLVGPDQAAWLGRLESEHDNFRAALAWCHARADGAEAGLRLAGALGRFWLVRGHLSEGRGWLARALEREGAEKPARVRARALHGASTLAEFQGDYAAARVLSGKSLAIGRELADRRGIADSLHNLGNVAYEQGDYPAARAYYEESLEIRRKLGDTRGMSLSLNNLGGVAYEQADYEAADVFYRASLAICRELRDRQGIAYALTNLGSVACDRGNYAPARSLYEESLAISRELRDRQGTALLLANLGIVSAAQGDPAAARALYQESLALFRELESRQGIAYALVNLGPFECREGSLREARDCLAECLALCRELGNRRIAAYALEGSAELAAAQDRPERAARLWGAAEALRRVINAPLPPGEREACERGVSAARAALGEEAFAAAWEAGQALTMERAVDVALAES